MLPKKGEVTDKQCGWGHVTGEEGDTNGGEIVRGPAGHVRTWICCKLDGKLLEGLEQAGPDMM